jgi:hypothetical protein
MRRENENKPTHKRIESWPQQHSTSKIKGVDANGWSRFVLFLLQKLAQSNCGLDFNKIRWIIP